MWAGGSGHVAPELIAQEVCACAERCLTDTTTALQVEAAQERLPEPVDILLAGVGA